MKDGGPAFPIPNDDRPGSYEAHPGMSLRDYFAGQALAGLCADGDITERYSTPSIADLCWELADEMLKARGEV